jgi:hypothetical protein
VRKHILNKHNEKLDEAKKEVIRIASTSFAITCSLTSKFVTSICRYLQVTYFNNYLLDPKRPQLPEHPSNKPRQPSSGSGSAQSNAPSTDSYGNGLGPGL